VHSVKHARCMLSNILKNINRNIDLYFLVQWDDFKAKVEVYATKLDACRPIKLFKDILIDAIFGSIKYVNLASIILAGIQNACWPKKCEV